MVVTSWDVIAISRRKKRGEFRPGIRNKGMFRSSHNFLRVQGYLHYAGAISFI